MKKVYLFFAAFVVASCVDDNMEKTVISDTSISGIEATKSFSNNEINKLKLLALTDDFKIPVEEAKELAISTAGQMREVEGLVTKAPLKIKTVEVISKGVKKELVQTKSDEQKESDLYLINFENNQGYVLTSADRRTSGVYAYSSTGNFGGVIHNSGEHILLERILILMDNKKKAFEKKRSKFQISAQEELFAKLSKDKQKDLVEKGLFDQKGKRIVSKNSNNDSSLLYSNDYDRGSWRTVYKKAPLVKTLWNQGGQYNDKVSQYCSANKDQALVGCVALAIGQIMTYHKKPSNFEGEYMNWDDMVNLDSGYMFSNIDNCNDQGKSDIQHLLARLGDKYLDMYYDCKTGSGATIDNAEKTFKRLGYNVSNQEYNSDKIISEIKANRPVYIRGRAFKDIETYTTGSWIFKKEHIKVVYSGGHAWIVDGYVRREQDVVVNVNTDGSYTTHNYKETLELVHNNFGRGGYIDGSNTSKHYAVGWYNKDIFSSNIGPSEASNTEFKSGTSGNYQYDNRIITVSK